MRRALLLRRESRDLSARQARRVPRRALDSMGHCSECQGALVLFCNARAGFAPAWLRRWESASRFFLNQGKPAAIRREENLVALRCYIDAIPLPVTCRPWATPGATPQPLPCHCHSVATPLPCHCHSPSVCGSFGPKQRRCVSLPLPACHASDGTPACCVLASVRLRGAGAWPLRRGLLPAGA